MSKLFSILSMRHLTLIYPIVFWSLFVSSRPWSLSLFFLAFGLLLGFGFFFFKKVSFFKVSPIDFAEIQATVHSLLFLALLVPISFFVVTSTGSLIGMGLVISLNTNLCLDLLSLSNNKEKLTSEFFSQLKRSPTNNEVNFLLLFWLVWTVGLWLIVLFS